jgi:hypothetical protein
MKSKIKIMQEYEDAFHKPKKQKSIFLTRDEAIEMLNEWLGSNNKDKINDISKRPTNQ